MMNELSKDVLGPVTPVGQMRYEEFIAFATNGST